MSQLFISYSRKDKNLADYLVNELEQSGHGVFIDNKDISSGEQWRTTIVKAIESADVKSDFHKHAYYCAVFIYSTFLTSLWIWMYTLSGALTRASISSKTLKKFITETFRVNEKPPSVLGLICISVVSIVFWGVHWATR